MEFDDVSITGPGAGSQGVSTTIPSTPIYSHTCTENKNEVTAQTHDILFYAQLARHVKTHGYPNVYGAKVPVESGWKLDKFESLLGDDGDTEVIQFLRYGFPANRLPHSPPPHVNHRNHTSAIEFPEFVDQYIDKQKSKSRIIGPVDNIPFDRVGVSPLSTREKKDTEDRRTILDLSFPDGKSVNDHTPKDTFLGIKVCLKYPTVDDLAQRLHQIGTEAMMFKRDLSSYFLQIPLDPADIELFGFWWRQHYYWFRVVVMGHRVGPYIAQRVSDAIAFIYRRFEYFILNYVDDFIGAEHKTDIWRAFYVLADLFNEVGAVESPEKAVPPSSVVEFLGVLFNAKTQTMEVTPQKLEDIHQITLQWLHKTQCTRTELEELIGKLQFVAACVRPGRIFIGRLLEQLRSMKRHIYYSIDYNTHKDVYWWHKFLPTYDGVSIMWMEMFQEDTIFSTDACLTGLGGVLWGKAYFRRSLPIVYRTFNIAYLEMLAIIVALKAWGEVLENKRILVKCDNEAVVQVINSGRAFETFLLGGMREICYLAATYRFEIRCVHVPTKFNCIPDALSRWAAGKGPRSLVRGLLEGGTPPSHPHPVKIS